jgi:hypothetical protein
MSRASRGVLGNHLEAIILGCVECRDHRVPARNEEGRVLGHISLHLFNFNTYGPGEELHCSMDLDTASAKKLDRLFDVRISGPSSGKS